MCSLPSSGLAFCLFPASWHLGWSLPHVLSGTSTRVMQPADKASSHTVTQPSKLPWFLLFPGSSVLAILVFWSVCSGAGVPASTACSPSSVALFIPSLCRE